MPQLCPRSELEPTMCAHCRRDEPVPATVTGGAMWAHAFRDTKALPTQQPATIVPVPSTAQLPMRRVFNPRIHQVPRSPYYSHAVV